MDEMKRVRVKYNGYTWSFPAHLIAKDRAQYYAEHDEETTYSEEFDFTINDDYQLKDWFVNNMNWSDVSKYARLEVQPFELQPNLIESEIEIY